MFKRGSSVGLYFSVGLKLGLGFQLGFEISAIMRMDCTDEAVREAVRCLRTTS